MRFDSSSSTLVVVSGSTFGKFYQILVITIDGETTCGEAKFDVRDLEEARSVNVSMEL